MNTLHKLRKAQISLGQNQLLLQLLHNELTARELLRAIEDCRLPIQDTRSCVILIQAFSSLHEEEDSLDTHQSLFSLKEQIENFLGNQHILSAQMPLSSLLLVMNLSPDEHELSVISPFLERQLSGPAFPSPVRLTAAIGKSADSLLDISASYQSARTIMGWHIYPEFGHVLDSRMLSFQQPPVLMPDGRIWDAVLKNDSDAICQEFSRYFSLLLNGTTPRRPICTACATT